MIPLTPNTLFNRANLWQSWLDVEAALARAQGRIGMIPSWAADAISEAACLSVISLDSLEDDAQKTLAPILSLTRLLSRAAGPAGDYVHWGATTQNVMQTGRTLLLREADAAIREELACALEGLANLAIQHAATPMAGRTNRQHALPITFGFKVAGWIEELDRATDRLILAAERMYALPFGGAVGAMHAYGPQGRKLYQELAKELGLRELLVPGRAVNDLVVDYVLNISLLAMSIDRIASELYRLMSEEIGEISERLDSGTVGSSTMPQKVNPKYVVKLLSQTAELRSLSSLALESGLSKHEGDAVANHMLSSVLDRSIPLAWTMVRGFTNLVGRIEPLPDRMQLNLGLTKGGIATEGLMMTLAQHLGRSAAHDLLHDILSQAANQSIAAYDAILADHRITRILTADQVKDELSPANYLGDSVAIAMDSARLGSQVAKRLRAMT